MRKSVGSFIALNQRAFLLLSVMLSLGLFGLIAWRTTANAQKREGNVEFGSSYRNDKSIPLRDMKPEPYLGKEMNREANENPKVPHRPHQNKPDEAVQDKTASLISLLAPTMPGTTQNFDGIGFPGVACNCAPPDTNGDVGQTQYVQIVNEGFQVFSKSTGASVFGPVGISTVWNGFGGVCQNNGNGDPIVLYDQLANRWVISQFAGVSVPTDECIAVSTTSDASGSYYRYAFHLGTNFFDYPHLAVWPDGYYMSDNVFNSSGTAFLGPQPFAFDRAKMLVGQPATFVTTGVTGGSNENVYLPADLDGSTLPPAGAPATFVEVPFGGAYRIFHFHADFATPANSTFTLFASPASAGFTELCPTTRACVPQSGQGSSSNLDGIGDRLMYRLATRFIGGHESTVGNFTVSAGGVAGIRWFELRNVTSGPVTVFQESTYQPDTTWRWMGSAGMDQDGNIAIGFSASSASIFPQIRYAGRLSGDPINTLAQGENTLFTGTGSQSGTSNRWGDYSALTIDPVDDCTFWYTQEYYQASGSFNWRTRVGSFKFTTCGGTQTPDFSLSTSPSSVTVTQGATANYTEDITRTGGFTGDVTFSISALPAGAAATFTPNPGTGASSVLAITTSAATPVGSYPFTVTGTNASLTRTSSGTLVVQAPVAENFTIAITPTSKTVKSGQRTNYTVNITRTGGFTGAVSFSVADLGTGASGTFSPNPTAGTSSTLTVRTTNAATAGSRAFTVTGSSGSLTSTATATLVVR